MRDFKNLVPRHVTPLALPVDREQKIVDEWSAQLEDLYEDLRSNGLPDDEAWRELQRQVDERAGTRRAFARWRAAASAGRTPGAARARTARCRGGERHP